MNQPENSQEKATAQPDLGNVQQINQIRQNVKQQVAQIRAHFLQIQQNSLKTMHESIQSVFKEQAAENLNKIAEMEKKIYQQMEETMTDAENINQEVAAQYSTAAEIPATETLYMTKGIEDSEALMQMIDKGIEESMQAAHKSLEDAEKLMSDLGAHKILGAKS